MIKLEDLEIGNIVTLTGNAWIYRALTNERNKNTSPVVVNGILTNIGFNHTVYSGGYFYELHNPTVIYNSTDNESWIKENELLAIEDGVHLQPFIKAKTKQETGQENNLFFDKYGFIHSKCRKLTGCASFSEGTCVVNRNTGKRFTWLSSQSNASLIQDCNGKNELISNTKLVKEFLVLSYIL